MSSTKYILTKFERMLRVEKVEYTIEIPDKIRNKWAYADKQVLNCKYGDYKIVDIPFSEMLEEEIYGLVRIDQE